MEDGFLFPSTDNHGEGDTSILEHWLSQDRDPVEPEGSDGEDIPHADMSASRNCYEDPFKVLAGYVFASQYCEEKPRRGFF